MYPRLLIIISVFIIATSLAYYINSNENKRFKSSAKQKHAELKISSEINQNINDITKVGSLKVVTPESWFREAPSSSMRLAQFYFKEGSLRAEVVVFSNIGGTIDQNINRWIEQFTDNNNDKIIENEFIDGMKTTFITISGTFKKGTMGMGGESESMNDYGLIAAIVETNKGPYYFKCTGPIGILKNNREVFLKFIRALKQG
tara:strand:+ start:717 stop:1322 length:606 start_codon:yes stop_codon:yes gene_type:complete